MKHLPGSVKLKNKNVFVLRELLLCGESLHEYQWNVFVCKVDGIFEAAYSG